MSKKEFIASLVEKMEVSKEVAEKAYTAFIETVEEGLVKNGKVQFIGFGSFEVKEREERNGVNPSTGESILIPASKSCKFKPAKALKDMLNA